MYAEVAVCLPLVRTFVYKLNDSVEPGCRVVVPFRKRDIEGFILRLRDDAPRDVEVHEVRSVVDPGPLLRPDVFELCRWIANYYVSPIGEVLKAALPPGITAKHMEKNIRKTGDSHPALSQRERAVTLTPDQSRALSAIQSSSGFHPILLHGVTGSGKTEVY